MNNEQEKKIYTMESIAMDYGTNHYYFTNNGSSFVIWTDKVLVHITPLSDGSFVIKQDDKYSKYMSRLKKRFKKLYNVDDKELFEMIEQEFKSPYDLDMNEVEYFLVGYYYSLKKLDNRSINPNKKISYTALEEVYVSLLEEGYSDDYLLQEDDDLLMTFGNGINKAIDIVYHDNIVYNDKNKEFMSLYFEGLQIFEEDEKYQVFKARLSSLPLVSCLPIEFNKLLLQLLVLFDTDSYYGFVQNENDELLLTSYALYLLSHYEIYSAFKINNRTYNDGVYLETYDTLFNGFKNSPFFLKEYKKDYTWLHNFTSELTQDLEDLYNLDAREKIVEKRTKKLKLELKN